jgi:phage terminase small subunit
MNARQQRFVQEYVKDGKAQQAAIRAGFSVKGAHVQATRLLKKVEVQAEIARLRAPVVEAAQVTLASHLKSLDDLRRRATKAKQFGPAVSAEVARGKASGLYTEKVEHSGEVEVLAYRRRKPAE